MKKITILITTFISFFASAIDETELRNRFYLSVESASDAKKFILELNKLPKNNSLEQGYKAATMMVMAKHVINPFSKLKYFMDGKNILENVIKKSPENVELIMIRFAIQTNVPQFLGYYKQINADKIVLLKKVSKLDSNLPNQAQLKQIIKQYLQQSNLCSKLELELIN